MKRYWEQLKPNERRVVVIVGFICFIVFNAWFIWPHFKDWRRNSARTQAAEKELARDRAMIAHKREIEIMIRALQERGGSAVLPEDQAIDLMRFFDRSAIENQVQIQNNSGVRTHTNDAFYVDQEITLNVMAREKGLVGFLFDLGSGSSMVRVRNMSLRPDQSHQQLNASVTFVASYQQKQPNKPAASSAPAKVVASAKATPPTMPVNASPKPVVPLPKPAANTNRTEPRFLRSGVTNKPGH
jgi:hypothetical protein